MKITKERLEHYAEKHLNPNIEVDRIDAFSAKLDVEKVLSFVEGNIVLEMGAGSGYYTQECIKKFGHSYIVDASSKLLVEAKTKFLDSVTCFSAVPQEHKMTIRSSNEAGRNSKLRKWL